MDRTRRTRQRRHRPGRQAGPLVALAAAGALALGGCASDPAVTDPGNGGEAGAPTTTVDPRTVDWAGSVCGALAPVGDTLAQPPAPDPTDPAGTQQAYISYLGQAQQSVEQALQQVEEIGAAPVEGGEQVVQNLQNQLTQLRDDLAEAQQQLEQADPNDPAGIGESAQAAANLLAAAGNQVQSVTTLVDDPQVERAVEQAPECERLTPTGAGS